MIYLKKFDYGSLKKGERKKTETLNGRLLLKEAVFREYGVDTDNLTIETGSHGKPYFSERTDIFFNISHSGDYAAVCVADSPVGIDIQEIRSVREGLEKKICTEEEIGFINNFEDRNKAFMILWALKESYIKAIGKGMTFPMKEVSFRTENFDGELKGELSNMPGSFFVKDLGDYILAVCSLEKEVCTCISE